MNPDYRYFYAIAPATASSRWFDSLIKVDVSGGADSIAAEWAEPGVFLTEASFLPLGEDEEEQEEGELPFRRSSIWFQEERSSLYAVTAEDTANPLREGDIKSDDDEEAAQPPMFEDASRGGSILNIDEIGVQMEEGLTPHEDDATFSAELVQEGVRILQKKILNQECSPPTLFAVLQVVSANTHKGIIAKQKAAASAMLAVPHWGEQVSAINIKEEKSAMRQQAALAVAAMLRSQCSALGYEESLDTETLPELLRAIASSSHGPFEEALRQVIVGAEARLCREAEEGGGGTQAHEEGGAVKLKVGPVKRVNRIAV